MAAADYEFETQGTVGTYQEGILTSTLDTDDTITLDVNETKVETIKSVSAHEAATGAPLQFSYADNVLTLETATQTDVAAVIKIYY